MGVFTAPDDSMQDKLEELGGKFYIWVKLILKGYLHKRLVWKAFW